MPHATLEQLLARNRSHTETIETDHFEGIEGSQHPPVVSLCCADSRVSQERMWDADEPGWLFTPSNIGNVAWSLADPASVDGNLLYPVANTETRTIVVVGHTGCGAITAAYEAVTDGSMPESPGIRRCVEALIPIVEEALDGAVADGEGVIDRLVEYNVREQVAFLDSSDEIPADATVFGFVYDMHRTYGSAPGRAYLVAADGETASEALCERFNIDDQTAVKSLL